MVGNPAGRALDNGSPWWYNDAIPSIQKEHIMKKQLKGIALLLFGILVSLFGISASSVLQGDYDTVVSLLGVLIGGGGLAMVFSRDRNN